MVLTKEKQREFATIGNIIQQERNVYKVYKNYGYDGTEAPFCKCGCGRHVKRSCLFPHNWNEYVYGHHNINSFIEYRNNRTPEEKKRDNKESSIRLKRIHREMKEKDPEGYSRLQSEKSLKFHRENPTFSHNHIINVHKKHPNMSRRSYEKRIANAPWYFMGVPFGSHQESNVAKLRFELLGIVPIEQENCHIHINRKEFDFEQFGFVHEHHPEYQWKGQTIIHPKEEYYKERREILDSNGHKKSELIVTTSIKEAEKLYLWLSKKLEFTPVEVV